MPQIGAQRLKLAGGRADPQTMTGPHGTFQIELMTAHHSVERDSAGGLVIYRDCVVRCADGVRRLYGIDVELLGGEL